MLVCHGTEDAIVEYRFGESAAEALRARHEEVELKTYPGLGHWASLEELKDVQAWLTKVIRKPQA